MPPNRKATAFDGKSEATFQRGNCRRILFFEADVLVDADGIVVAQMERAVFAVSGNSSNSN
jgi:hypothetical protein